MNKVYTYSQDYKEHYDFILERNRNYARKLAELTKKEYAGDLKDLSQYIDASDLVVVHNVISPDEAISLGILSVDNIFGSSMPMIYANKSILHTPVYETAQTPIAFPVKLTYNLDSVRIVLPGHSVFNMNDAVTAFEKLVGRYTIRIKDAGAGAGINQFIVNTKDELARAINKVGISRINKYGLVLEANLEPNNNDDVKSYSGGWTLINGQKYSYIGEQEFGETGTIMKYKGTKILLVKGDLNDLKKVVENETHENVISKLAFLEKEFAHIPNALCSRYNFDFIEGKVVTKENDTIEGIFLTDHSFRPGGATAAELYCIEQIEKTGAKLVTATSKLIYTSEYDSYKGPAKASYFDGYDDTIGNVKIVVE